MDRKKEIINIINGMTGRYSAYEIYNDWIKCSALAVSNSLEMTHNRIWQEREKLYKDTIGKYTPDEGEKFSEMFLLLTEAMDERMSDILGEIYMESGMGSGRLGQFFTPYHVSEMCAELSLTEPDEHGNYVINEPSCGGGGMIIAMASALKGRGINYQKRMQVVAQDLDWKSVYMCYIQLSFYGIRAVVAQGDTLSEPYRKGYPRERVLYTPAEKGMLI